MNLAFFVAACFKWTSIDFINGNLTLPLIGQTLQQTYACSNRLSQLDAQTLFYLLLFTLGLATVCILPRFVYGLIKRSSSSSEFSGFFGHDKFTALNIGVTKNRKGATITISITLTLTPTSTLTPNLTLNQILFALFAF